MFCLCRTCVLNTNTGECCNTTEEERALSVTWVIDEFLLAVQKVYRMLEVQELYEYNVTRYDTNPVRRPVCRLYRHFSEIKEASVYPAWVRSPVDKERYI